MLINKYRFPVRQMLTVGILPSQIKTWYYHLQGANIKPGVKIGFASVIVADEICIGEDVQIGFGTYLRARKVEIGRYSCIGSTTFIDAETIKIGEDAKISEQVFIGGLSSPESHFWLGARTTIMQHTFINVAHPVTIGNDTGIGGKCTIFTHGSWQNMLDGYPVSFAPVTIGNNVWLPWEVFVMPGVTIGDGATIGASSLVTKDIPAGCLAVGSPAKVIHTPDQYPKRPELPQQVDMLQNMIREFCEYLEHGHVQVIREKKEGYELVSVTDSKGCHYNLAIEYNMPLIEIFDPVHMVLSLPGLSDQRRQDANREQQMWADIPTKQRGGMTNPLGEELLEFIKRYGLRFARSK